MWAARSVGLNLKIGSIDSFLRPKFLQPFFLLFSGNCSLCIASTTVSRTVKIIFTAEELETAKAEAADKKLSLIYPSHVKKTKK